MQQSRVPQDATQYRTEPSALPAVERTAATPAPRAERFYALDALRGLAIGLMVFVNWAGNWSLPPTFAHADWDGLTLADTVFPGFLVAMGTAMPYATRVGWRRVVGRAIMLYLVGSVLVSYKYGLPFDLYPGVLQMIGVSYLLTWLVTRLPRPLHLPIVATLLAAVTAAYLWLGVPGVPAGSLGPEVNLAQWFDGLLGFEPGPENPHAWIPAIGSVYLGVMAGRISRENSGRRRLGLLAALGGSTLALGLLLSLAIPLNKYLWTSSFVLVTGGLAVLVLVVLALMVPGGTKGGPLRPLVILGGHAIVVYAFSETIVGRLRDEWLWPTWEPIVTERFGELAAGVAFPLAAVFVCLLLAWAMELLDIRVRL